MTLEELRDACVASIDAQVIGGRPARVYLAIPKGEKAPGGRGLLRQLMCVNPAGESVYTYDADALLRVVRQAIITRDGLEGVITPEELHATRASGKVRCIRCQKLYEDHPLEAKYLSWDGHPYLNRLCDGRLVKL